MVKSAAAVESSKEKSDDGRDRRKQERFECSGFAEVVLDDAAFLFRGIIRDLSLTGCYIQSRARLMLDLGTTVELKFSVKSDELLLPARIAIIRPGAGAGFEFFEIQPSMQSRLSSLIYKLANPASESGVVRSDTIAKETLESSSSRDLWHRDR
jgi:hypothetical protein